jgi:hypothetical protein
MNPVKYRQAADQITKVLVNGRPYVYPFYFKGVLFETIYYKKNTDDAAYYRYENCDTLYHFLLQLRQSIDCRDKYKRLTDIIKFVKNECNSPVDN